MKKLLVFIAFLTFSIAMYGQNMQNQSGLGFKKMFLDYQSQNGGEILNLRNYQSGYEISYLMNLTDRLNLTIPVYSGVRSITEESEFIDTRIFGFGGNLSYQFYKPENKVIPFLFIGAHGVTEMPGKFNFQLPLGVGLDFKMHERAYITWESSYRLSFTDNRNNLTHSIGFKYLFGESTEKVEIEEEDVNDADGDGLRDEVDLCPQIAGKIELKGCPDFDNDGLADYEDACPEDAGPIELKGCPDKDGDGISDKDDECPNMAGPKENKGCPKTESNDRDNDGIVDSKDKCPDTPGPSSNLGCPLSDADGDGIPDSKDSCPNSPGPASTYGCPDSDGDGVVDYADKCPDKPGIAAYGGCPDTDGDGLDDSRDRCPNSPGSVDNNGCPEIDTEDLEVLDLAMRAVQFDTGNATLKLQSSTVLNQIADIMRKYPDFKLVIAGHTDNTGTASANQDLSQRRAKACHDFLVNAGIAKNRMSYTGYGESRPIADNNSLRGRALNRRVEFTLLPR